MTDHISERKVEKGKSSPCKSCGAPVELRFPGKSLTITCDYCGTILDSSSDEFKIIQEYKDKRKLEPMIPLGSKGKFEDHEFEVVGFLEKSDNYNDKWHEYLMINPYLGYRYLSYWQGHWNYIKLVKGFPFDDNKYPVTPGRSPAKVKKEGRKYKHFFNYDARVEYVLGEFNWKVKTGDSIKVVDYINPPYALSGEFSKTEAVWSVAEYTEAKVLERAFAIEGLKQKKEGIAPNQINPFKIKRWLGIILAITSIIFISTRLTQISSTAKNLKIFEKKADLNLTLIAPKVKKGYLSKEFEIKLGDIEITGNEANNLEVTFYANVNNSWVYLSLFLMHEESKKGYVFSREISYYHGYSGGESWTEGSTTADFLTEKMPPGKYYGVLLGETNVRNSLKLRLKIVQDVVSWLLAMMCILVILMPPIYYFIRKSMFETRRNA